jgi:Cu(I)/Ag(I) efflux system membrane protein CusA/SilA
LKKSKWSAVGAIVIEDNRARASTPTATRGFFVDIIPDRNAIARYGLTMRDVQDVIEAAIGGMPVEVTVEGRNRFTINVRYPRELRQDVERLKQIEVPLPSNGGTSSGGMSSIGASTLTYESPFLASTNSDFDYQVLRGMGYAQMDKMGAGQAASGSSMPSGSTGTTGKWLIRRFIFVEAGARSGNRVSGGRASVPLADLRDQNHSSPPMIRDENGMLSAMSMSTSIRINAILAATSTKPNRVAGKERRRRDTTSNGRAV